MTRHPTPMLNVRIRLFFSDKDKTNPSVYYFDDMVRKTNLWLVMHYNKTTIDDHAYEYLGINDSKHTYGWQY